VNSPTTKPHNDIAALLEASTAQTADLTPMLDTIFLIILLLLATLMNSSIVRGFPVNLPSFEEPTEIQKHKDPVEVSLDKAGNIYVAKTAVSLSSIETQLKTALTKNPDAKVLLRADNDVPYGKVAQILCRVSNALPATEVVLVTQQPGNAKNTNKNNSQPRITKAGVK
jgi:biopolymer transport protein ExbD